MAVVVDTGPFVGLLNDKDPWHKQAMALWGELRSGRHGRVLSADVVFVEAMNFLGARPHDARLSTAMADQYERATPVAWLATSPDCVRQASRLHLQHFDARLSLTDAVVAVHAMELGAKVATFDSGFDGIVATVKP